MAQPLEQCPVLYRCPGDESEISRAVHLGRLTRFYPRCRSCPHRADTEGLPAKHVKRLGAAWQHGTPGPLFHGEGAGADSANDFPPASARKIAAAFGTWLRQAKGVGESPEEPPVAVLGGDGSPRAPELIAAVAEGLRWTGCRVVDVGQVTAACLTFALHHLGADGGILAGSGGKEVGAVGVKFWHRAWPLSAGDSLDQIRRLFESGVDRPTRRFGPIGRFQAEPAYWAGLTGHYHALRPLRIALSTDCRPLLASLRRLTSQVACRILPCRDQRAHLGLDVDGDGECCRAYDESGREVPAERLFALVARHLMAIVGKGVGATFVLDEGWRRSPPPAIAACGARTVFSGPRRAEMARQVCRHRAILGADHSGRVWYYHTEGYAAADALRTITLLLEILSQSDRPLSAILDAAGPA